MYIYMYIYVYIYIYIYTHTHTCRYAFMLFSQTFVIKQVTLIPEQGEGQHLSVQLQILNALMMIIIIIIISPVIRIFSPLTFLSFPKMPFRGQTKSNPSGSQCHVIMPSILKLISHQLKGFIFFNHSLLYLLKGETFLKHSITIL